MTTMVGVNKSQRTYLPAAGRDLFLPLYDLVARLLGADQARQSLLDQPQLRSECVTLLKIAGFFTRKLLCFQRRNFREIKKVTHSQDYNSRILVNSENIVL